MKMFKGLGVGGGQKNRLCWQLYKHQGWWLYRHRDFMVPGFCFLVAVVVGLMTRAQNLLFIVFFSCSSLPWYV